MTINEKAQAYDKALEAAQKELKQDLHESGVWAIKRIFPQLTESEDEKIIDGFHTLLKGIRRDGGLTLNKVPLDKCEAWLEKQKYDRMQPVYDNQESFESALEKAWNDYHNGYENVDKLEDDYIKCAHAKGFREGYLFGFEKQKESLRDFIDDFPYSDEQKELPFDEDKFLEGELSAFLQNYDKEYDDDAAVSDVARHFYEIGKKQKEPLPIPDKFSGLKSLMLQYLQSAANRKDDSEIESDTDLWGRKILAYVWKYSDEQKEQKPVEPNWIHHKVDLSGCSEEYCKAYFDGWNNCNQQHEQLKAEQKPAEWSKNDTVFLNEITDFFENKTVKLQHDIDMYAHWLKSLPERFNLQPKQEWSEEDEKMSTNILNLISSQITYVTGHGTMSGKQYPTYTKERDWFMNRLKSLRPQSKDEIYKEKDEAFKLGKHQLAIKFMNYLDENRPEGKMGLSNGECEDIDKAFKENNWTTIMRYMDKYRPSWKPSEEQMKALLNIEGDLRAFQYNDKAKIIAELYEQLKNL